MITLQQNDIRDKNLLLERSLTFTIIGSACGCHNRTETEALSMNAKNLIFKKQILVDNQ